MKKSYLFSLLVIFLTGSFLCGAQTLKKEVSSANQVEAYYFHNSSRCVTCKTVEAEAKTNLENLYGNRVTFRALNLEDDATKVIAKKLEVSGQTLLIVKGDKKINLTNEGFMYARTNPAKFKSIIKEKVDALIDL